MTPDTAALDLPFDSDRMLDGLRPWIETESPTFDAAAVNRMMGVAARDLALAGATVETIPGRMNLGDCVRARFDHPSKEPGILVLGHLDTVHPMGTINGQLNFRREGNKAYGPGIQDMKGGNYIALEAVKQLRAAGIQTSRPVTFLFTSDEEIGSPPARHDSEVVTGRYAIARFNMRATGRPSHAGARLAEGRSAIKEMCKQILAIEDMTTEACTFSVGVLQGGTWVNCVTTHCDAEALSMAKRQEDLDAAVEKMLALRASGNDVSFEVKRGVTRPVWEPNDGVMLLHSKAQALAERLGFNVPSQSAGGGSDGNFTGAMGIPTLDGLGVRGALAHTLEEHIFIDSLAERGKLFAGLLQVV